MIGEYMLIPQIGGIARGNVERNKDGTGVKNTREKT